MPGVLHGHGWQGGGAEKQEYLMCPFKVANTHLTLSGYYGHVHK